jgi:hypothetical protein
MKIVTVLKNLFQRPMKILRSTVEKILNALAQPPNTYPLSEFTEEAERIRRRHEEARMFYHSIR